MIDHLLLFQRNKCQIFFFFFNERLSFKDLKLNAGLGEQRADWEFQRSRDNLDYLFISTSK